LRRQRLITPLENETGYIELFRQLQPVSTLTNARPGSPPRLVHRARFEDGVLTSDLRAERILVKGRFLGGGIGYVLADDLELYANAFQRPLPMPNATQMQVWEAVQSAGPLTPRQLKDETELLNKKIMPALHRLQKAFLVYEDQIDEDWERSWYSFASEWPAIEIDINQREKAVARVLRRFLENHVFATFEQIKDWSQLATRLLKKVSATLEDAGRIVPQTIAGLGEGWLRAADHDLPETAAPASVFMLHKADILTRSHISELKRRFAGLEVLQYLLIDGAFQGAVVGHWRIGPHNVDDIVLILPSTTRDARRDAIITAVAQGYQPPYARHRHFKRSLRSREIFPITAHCFSPNG